MGAILDRLPAADPFSAEVRRESFYVATGYDDIPMQAQRVGDHMGTFSVPASHVPALLAVFDQVMSHPAYVEWSTGLELRSGDIGPDAPAVVWSVVREDDRVAAAGRVIAFVGGGEWAPAQSIELCYRDLGDLVDLIGELRSTRV